MRFMLGAGSRIIHITVKLDTWAPDPESAESPSIYDLSGAHVERRPQVDHEGDVVTARLGFQPNEKESDL